MIEINLLGFEKHKKRKTSDTDISQIFALSIAAVLLIEVVFAVFLIFHFNNKVEELTQKRNNLKGVEREVKIIKAKLREVNSMIAAIKNLEKGRGQAYKDLKDVADVMPNGLWLTRLSKRGKTIKIEGKSFTAEAVAQYMTSLGSLKNVVRVRFDRSGLVRLSHGTDRDVYKFYISVTLKG